MQLAASESNTTKNTFNNYGKDYLRSQAESERQQPCLRKVVRKGEEPRNAQHTPSGAAHLGARQHLHPRRGVRCVGEVPQLSVHIRFLPEQATEENISSREFLKKAEFINVDALTAKAEDSSGGDSDSGDDDGE